MAAAELFAVWTRYVRPDGKIVRHVYGPYPTRAKAQTCLRELHRNADMYGIPDGVREAHVTKLISDR